eukprot:scaffold894_cov153-Cylindrotheca_fusiformis.AAC.19
MISNSEQKFVVEGCRENCRQDGRTRQEFRSYTTITGGGGGSSSSSTTTGKNEEGHPPLVLSNGSARVFLATGETHVMVSVKAELVIPAISHPNSGVIDIHVDYMHNNNDKDDALTGIISSLLLPHLVEDTEQLCVVPHFYVWRLSIDVLVIASNGGSLLDACSLGIRAAIQNTLLPKLTHEAAGTTNNDGDGKPVLQIDADIQNAHHIPGSDKVPIVATVSLLKTENNLPILILDATKEEEMCAFSQIHVVIDTTSRSSEQEQQPVICALHKAGGGSLPFSLLQDVTAFVLEVAPLNDNTVAAVVVNDGQQHMLQETFAIQ